MLLITSFPRIARATLPVWPVRTIAAIKDRGHAALRRRRKISQIIRELGALSDHDLADIGILRCDIGRLARETVDRR
jgi:uncharacterized protein YjiS (DUF1127 family)